MKLVIVLLIVATANSDLVLGKPTGNEADFAMNSDSDLILPDASGPYNILLPDGRTQQVHYEHFPKNPLSS